MKLAKFEYSAPETLDEAIAILSATPGAKLISGGQSLIPLMAFRLAAPTLLVDLKGVPGLETIEIGDDGIRIGARVRWIDIERDRRLTQAHPLLAKAISHVAHYQIRNRGTVGGSLAHADPAAEMPGVAVTCDATMELAGPNGRRHVPAASFFTGALQTRLEDDEILIAVHLPAWQHSWKWAFAEFARRRGDFALAGVLILYAEQPGGLMSGAQIGAIGIGDHPVRLEASERMMNGRTFGHAVVKDAVEAAFASLEPQADLHASSAYRKSLFCTLLDRALWDSRMPATGGSS